MSFLTCVSLLLIAAKLFGYQHYGWLVALSPFLISFGVALLNAVLSSANDKIQKKQEAMAIENLSRRIRGY